MTSATSLKMNTANGEILDTPNQLLMSYPFPSPNQINKPPLKSEV